MVFEQLFGLMLDRQFFAFALSQTLQVVATAVCMQSSKLFDDLLSELPWLVLLYTFNMPYDGYDFFHSVLFCLLFGITLATIFAVYGHMMCTI